MQDYRRERESDKVVEMDAYYKTIKPNVSKHISESDDATSGQMCAMWLADDSAKKRLAKQKNRKAKVGIRPLSMDC